MSKYLFEVGVEELPYKFIPMAIEQLKQGFIKFLEDNKEFGFVCSDGQTYKEGTLEKKEKISASHGARIQPTVYGTCNKHTPRLPHLFVKRKANRVIRACIKNILTFLNVTHIIN